MTSMVRGPGSPRWTRFYKGPIAPHSIVAVDGELHRFLRRLLAREFSDVKLREQEPVNQRSINLLIEKLHDEVAAGKTPEMTAMFNLICDIRPDRGACIRRDLWMENWRYHPWVKMIFYVMKLRALTHAVGYCSWVFPILCCSSSGFARLIRRTQEVHHL
ncbi:uncharacterized protein ANIA_10101 [Aspergillus nidulans FGSC A4]|uniref:Uncharacterized protein n=1 Tax=Emericella nidulans (strain FGSC A4 / ATCC 38163 / CBS 112.46 / NRRL 194 / M139) TaxID=227321 RepID=C8VSM2_EMENI|nr:hypothetical protein [Aspergillus nidulans FGSC A4]CBF89262.1 TPA: hypothetical protein ANIA_10101 [Aspergillus nidulans FGSC A4]